MKVIWVKHGRTLYWMRCSHMAGVFIEWVKMITMMLLKGTGRDQRL